MSTEPLSPAARRDLSSRANRLACAVRIGRAGVSAGTLDEVGRAFDRAPLVKVRLAVSDRTARKEQALELARASGAQLVGTVGRYAVLVRDPPTVPHSSSP